MGYSFVISKEIGFRPIEKMTVPWPCQDQPDRTIDLHPGDILTQDEDGTWAKHTGLGCVRIRVEKNRLKQLDEDVRLRII